MLSIEIKHREKDHCIEMHNRMLVHRSGKETYFFRNNQQVHYEEGRMSKLISDLRLS